MCLLFVEVSAYSGVVSALRAQGDLTKERRKILTDLSHVLNISPDRHKTEIRRAVNDETLATVALRTYGPSHAEEWTREGRRIIPILRRAAPVTAFSPAADRARREIEVRNAQLAPPVKTRAPKRGRALAPSKRAGLNPAPPALHELIGENGEVRPPPMAVPARPKITDPDALGDVVILPSGLAVRFKEDPKMTELKEESPAVKGKRKRKCQSDVDEAENLKGSIEILPPGFALPSSPHPLNMLSHLDTQKFAPPSGGRAGGKSRKKNAAANPPKVRHPMRPKNDIPNLFSFSVRTLWSQYTQPHRPRIRPPSSAPGTKSASRIGRKNSQ